MNSLVNMRQAWMDKFVKDTELERKFGTPISFPGYCPKCNLFNHLPKKNEDGKDICLSCWRKENASL